MALFFNDLIYDLLAITATIFVLILTYFNNAYQYWAKRNVPHLKPKFPLGNTLTFFPRSLTHGTMSKHFYDELKKLNYTKYGGIYTVSEPNFVVLDPKIIKDILITDFYNFTDRGFYHNEKNDPMSAHLFSVDSVKWRNLRTKLTPTFTSGKMKMMFNSIVDCSTYMVEALNARVDKPGQDVVDIKEIMSSFTIDVIGICAFGVNCNSFKHPNAEFKRMGEQIFQNTDISKRIKSFFMINLPKVALKLGITSNNPEVIKFFTKMVNEAVTYRETNQIRRNDFLQLLIDVKTDEKEEKDKLTMDEIVAQVFVFFIAGFDTSSSAMAFALYELALNSSIQDRLRNEINEVLAKHDQVITYESLNEMKYLGQVIDEALRKYPSLPIINRRCVKDYKLRDYDVTIEKGIPIIISTLGLHRDPDYFPDPEKFDPDRFSEENRKNIKPFTYLPFGDGPRNCIGLRFGQMQSKIGLIQMVRNFKLSVSPKTKEPIELDPCVFLITTKDKIFLKIEKIV